MFDNVCKFLTETFSTDYASWLLGVTGLTVEQIQQLQVMDVDKQQQ